MSENLEIQELIDFDIRSEMFRDATRFVDYELVEGDIMEFGVYTGRSLALLAYYHGVNKLGIHKCGFSRRIVGFDSFAGLPGSDGHPRWYPGMFGRNHSFHPLCAQGDKVSQETVIALFDHYRLPLPIIEVGSFQVTLRELFGVKYQKVAIAHIDCDLYESTKIVLFELHNLFQHGSIILFDDWFNFKGGANMGEQKAFLEYIKMQHNWAFVEYHTYATFGKSFIVQHKSS